MFRSAYAFAGRQHTGIFSKSKSARKRVYWRLRGSTEIFKFFEKYINKTFPKITVVGIFNILPCST